MDLEIIKADLNHADEIGYIHATSWHAAYKGLVPDDFLFNKMTPEKRAARFRKSFPDNPYPYYIFRVGEKPAGMAVFGKTQDEDVLQTTGEIGALYFLPEFWGQGYAHTAMEFCLKALENTGYKPIILWVLEANKRARCFYEKFNFKTEGARKTIDHGITLPLIRYIRETKLAK